MKDIPREMIFNWDQTGLSIIPTGNWTMEREGAKVVSIAHADDKRQITAVLAVTATGEYLAPQPTIQGEGRKMPSTSAVSRGVMAHQEPLVQ